MPRELGERIAADVKVVAADPAVVSRLNATGQVVIPGTPTEFAASIEGQRAKLAAIAAVLGLKPAQ
jgi:hypothetical protein